MVAKNVTMNLTRTTSVLYFLGFYALFQLCKSSTFRLLRSDDLSNNLAFNSNLFLNKFKLDLVADIVLPEGAAFLSCLSPKDDKVDIDLHCIYRVSGIEYPENNYICRVVVDGTTYRVKTPLSAHNEVEEKDLRAEDPRIFTWNDEAYVLNNYWRYNDVPYTVDNFDFEVPVSIFHLDRTSDGLGQVIDYYKGNASDPNIPQEFVKNVTSIAVSDERLILIDFMAKKMISCTRQDKPGFQFTLNCMVLENTIYNYEPDIIEVGKNGIFVVDRLTLRFLLAFMGGLVI